MGLCSGKLPNPPTQRVSATYRSRAIPEGFTSLPILASFERHSAILISLESVKYWHTAFAAAHFDFGLQIKIRSGKLTRLRQWNCFWMNKLNRR